MHGSDDAWLGLFVDRGFLGVVHLEALLSLGLSITDLPRLISNCLRDMFEKIRDLAEYLEALRSGE